jgi:methionyl-tRNA formyltransferase
MRLAFFGSDAIALPALEYLHWADGIELAGLVSQPDKPAGRGRHLHTNPVSAWAHQQGLPLLQPEKPGEEEISWLKTQHVDLVLVMAYGHILKKDLLETPRLGMWNLHASLLPVYRGASPVETALACGEKETGVSLMRIVAKMDAGPVAAQVHVPIRNTDTGPVLRERIGHACVPLLLRHLKSLAENSVTPAPQDDAKATYCRKLHKTDAHLDFALSAEELACRIRAFQPWPGVTVTHGEVELKVGSASIVDETTTAAPGAVLRVGEGGVDVATSAGVLRLLSLQRPGGRMLEAAEFLRGYRLEAGTVLKSHVLRPLVSATPFPRPSLW